MTEMRLDDERDRMIFIEYYPAFCVTACWHDNGELDWYTVARINSEWLA